jgi:hypothetical protein
MNEGGRPSKYEPDMCGKVVERGKDGKSKAQIAASLGVCRQTLDNWITDNPDFAAAMKTAQDLALAWWEDKGQDGLSAERFNATAFIFQMKNRFRDDYRDKIESDNRHSGPDGGPIPVHAKIERVIISAKPQN